MSYILLFNLQYVLVILILFRKFLAMPVSSSVPVVAPSSYSFALGSHLIKSEMKKKTQYQNTCFFRKPEETVFVASGTRG